MAVQELAQDRLQPGEWDLGQALPLLCWQRQQGSDAGVLPAEPHGGFNQGQWGQSVG